MDGDRFDTFVRALAAPHSRRSVVRALAGSAAGGLLALGGGAAGAAPRCKRVNQRCQTSEDCCPGPTRNGNVSCAATHTCQPCPSATPTACNGGCVDTTSDNANCGVCNTICSGGTSCVNGVCACPGGQTLCAGQCVNPNSDPKNCGACGRPCEAGQLCCHGTCVDAQGDPGNCGACDTVCAAGQACVAGTCACTPESCPCGCFGTTEGSVCAQSATSSCADVCTSSADCPSGQVCLIFLCGQPSCATITPAQGSSNRRRRARPGVDHNDPGPTTSTVGRRPSAWTNRVGAVGRVPNLGKSE